MAHDAKGTKDPKAKREKRKEMNQQKDCSFRKTKK